MAPDLQTQERALDAARYDLRTVQILQLLPGLSAGVREMLKDNELAARAEVKARREEIERAKGSRLKWWLTSIPRSLGM